jgi:hypothetical protein
MLTCTPFRSTRVVSLRPLIPFSAKMFSYTSFVVPIFDCDAPDAILPIETGRSARRLRVGMGVNTTVPLPLTPWVIGGDYDSGTIFWRSCFVLLCFVYFFCFVAYNVQNNGAVS